MDIPAAKPLAVKTNITTENLKPSENERSAKSNEAAQQFENVLALQFVRGMTKSLDGESLLTPGDSGEMFGSLVEWKLAEQIAKSTHWGLSESILRELAAKEAANHETDAR